MKLYVYDMVDFETELLQELQETSVNEICLTTQSLTLDTLSLAAGCIGVSVLGYSKIGKDLLDRMKEMGIGYLSTRTIGYDHIDVKYAKEIGIRVFNAYYQPDNVADFAVMLMLMMLRKAKISVCRALVNDFSLDGMQGREMHSMTVGVIGTGKIGKTVIRNLSGFGCRMLAYDLYPDQSIQDKVTYVSLEELYRESDIITLHTPLNDNSYHMINDESIAMMKDGVILINTARGQLIDTDALIRALEEEKVGGAAIDTVEAEEGIMHVHVGTKILNEGKRDLLYLKQFPNVIYTQHYAFYTREATTSMVRCGITSIEEAAAGRKLPNELTV